MAQIQPVLRAEINPADPVREICEVISSVAAFHPGQEQAVLEGVKDAIETRLKKLEKEDKK